MRNATSYLRIVKAGSSAISESRLRIVVTAAGERQNNNDMSYIRAYSEILEQIEAIHPTEYAKTRNHLDGAVTRLSPYISRGVITLPEVREQLLTHHSAADCQKLIQELAWREYFQRVWWEKGDAIFADIRFARTDWQHSDVVSAVVNAETGITVLDDGIKALYETGYMHNHVRMWVASVSCNLAGAHWHTMGRWLYAHLIDGDLASNFLSWQWVAGTAVQKRYTVNQELINACSGIEQHDTFLDFERDDMHSKPAPDILQNTEAFNLTTSYPDTEVTAVTEAEVHLYTPWTLHPRWRAHEPAQRILIIDPHWFDAYPVSDAVLDFIIRQGKIVIPDLQVFVGQLHELPQINTAAVVRAIAHPTNQDWLVQFDEPAWLFPEVSGYYPSFFKYWQAVQQRY